MPKGVYERTPEILSAIKASGVARRKGTGVCRSCGGPAAPQRVDWCSACYRRMWRYGTTDYQRPNAWRNCEWCGERFKALTRTTATGTQRIRFCSKACRGAAIRGEKHAGWIGDAVGYGGMHDRVRGERGNAKLYACADCGGSAEEWSFSHETPMQYMRVGPKGKVYSLRVQDYEPRCVPCHRKLDLARETREEIRARKEMAIDG